MAAAAMISFEETRQSFAKTRARHQLQAYLDGGLDRLEANMPDDTPSLEALTQAVCTMRQELTGRITQALVEQPHARALHHRTMRCPHCQGILPARRAQPRTVHTMVGEVPCPVPTATAGTVSRASLPGMKSSSCPSAAPHGTCRRPGPDWPQRSRLRRPRSCSWT